MSVLLNISQGRDSLLYLLLNIAQGRGRLIYLLLNIWMVVAESVGQVGLEGRV